jgi:hypothetical protein
MRNGVDIHPPAGRGVFKIVTFLLQNRNNGVASKIKRLMRWLLNTSHEKYYKLADRQKIELFLRKSWS